MNFLPTGLRFGADILRRSPWALCRRRPLGYIGWVGHNNLGDEAIYSAIRRLFSAFNFDLFDPGGRDAILRRIGLSGPEFFRGILLGGGTLVNPAFMQQVQDALAQKQRLYMFGTGVGSSGFGLAPAISLDGWREALTQFRFLSVRGPLSQAALCRAGVPVPEVVGDPALGYAVRTLPERRDRPRLIVNLTLPGQAERHILRPCINAVAAIAARFQRDGGEVIPVALGEGDKESLITLAREAALNNTDLIDCRQNVNLFLETVKGSDALIGMRLHSAVLACCVGVAPLLFGYRDKCADFLQSMNLSHHLIEFSDDAVDSLNRAWVRLRDADALGSRILERAHHWQAVQIATSSRIAKELISPRD
ncbi:MAG TPA: polysaccharide pyruvyl transferase family protein [Bryobacteraceae bacterium]|jgi:polysaccharide pyruvyl transferase WcaK-like protein|nr:polysaccharide pyruvyl transferase family protein [Bryobacteraceae bacterium]